MDNVIEGEMLTPAPRVQGKAITMSFPDAVKEIIKGKKVARLSWENQDYGLLKDGWLEIFTNNNFHVWKVSDGDLESNDWVIVGAIQ